MSPFNLADLFSPRIWSSLIKIDWQTGWEIGKKDSLLKLWKLKRGSGPKTPLRDFSLELYLTASLMGLIALLCSFHHGVIDLDNRVWHHIDKFWTGYFLFSVSLSDATQTNEKHTRLLWSGNFYFNDENGSNYEWYVWKCMKLMQCKNES